MRTVIGILLAASFAFAQGTLPQPLQVTRVYNITTTPTTCTATSSQCVDNRGTDRKNNFHSFYATGTGTWTVAMQHADSAGGPWTNFGAEGSVSNGSVSTIGHGDGYYAFIRFNISGTVNVSYSGFKDLFIPSPTGADCAGPFSKTGATWTITGAQHLRGRGFHWIAYQSSGGNDYLIMTNNYAVNTSTYDLTITWNSSMTGNVWVCGTVQ